MEIAKILLDRGAKPNSESRVNLPIINNNNNNNDNNNNNNVLKYVDMFLNPLV